MVANNVEMHELFCGPGLVGVGIIVVFEIRELDLDIGCIA
jgi:hypothetical protein